MSRLRLRLLIPLLLLVAAVWILRVPIQGRIRERATVTNESPPPDLVGDMINQSAHPQAAILAAWNSGRIIHREVAIGELRHWFPPNQPLPPEFEGLLLSAALDPDLSVREIAFGLLWERQHPASLALAAAQLRDVDPMVRTLGLEQLRSAPAAVVVRLAAGLLDDPDPAVLGLAAKLLERGSGETFGVKLSETVPVANQTDGAPEFQAAGVARTRAAAERARIWWSAHSAAFPPASLEVPPAAKAARRPVPAGDFPLRTLEGQDLRLGGFRGKVVLVNFWTTWCPACVGEIPGLISLRKQAGGEVVIIGVSLDSVPNEEGEVGGEGSGQKLDPQNHRATAALLEQVRAKVSRTATARGINYPVVLDVKNAIGGRFNGGELPTTVIVDAEGMVRRRFVGPRTAEVFAAMVAEARKPRTD